jgi:hypothetical protein
MIPITLDSHFRFRSPSFFRDFHSNRIPSFDEVESTFRLSPLEYSYIIKIRGD